MKKPLQIVLSLLIGFGFFLLISRTPSVVNMIPFALHERFFRGIFEEYTFIMIFDVLLSLIVAYIVYSLLARFYKRRSA